MLGMGMGLGLGHMEGQRWREGVWAHQGREEAVTIDDLETWPIGTTCLIATYARVSRVEDGRAGAGAARARSSRLGRAGQGRAGQDMYKAGREAESVCTK